MSDERTARLRRRVYKEVSVVEKDGRYGVTLDGRAIKTPEKRELAVLTLELAQAVAAEWDAQEERIDPTSMPLMQITCTCLDRVEPHRVQIEETIAKYGETDLLCHRVEAPEDLAGRQSDIWQPELDWLKDEFGIDLKVTYSILPALQPQSSLIALRKLLHEIDAHELAALAVLTQTLGSIVLGLSVLKGRMSGVSAADASLLDEIYQSELWGQDREAEQRQRALRQEITEAERYLALHRTKI